MTPTPTSSSRRLLLTPVPWLLLVAMVVAQAAVVDDVAADVQGDGWLGGVLMFAAVVPVSWAVLETLWLSFPGPRPMVALQRTLVLPLLMGPILGLTAGLSTLLPGVQDVIESTRRADGWHYWFDASRGGGGLGSELPLYVIVNMFAPMLAGLVLVVVIVLPYYAFVRPAEFVAANMMDTSREAAAANAAGARLLSILLIVIFAGPTAVIWLSELGRARQGWTLAIALVAVGVWLMSRVLIVQVPDHAARGTLPRWARGVQTRRYESGQDSSGRRR